MLLALILYNRTRSTALVLAFAPQIERARSKVRDRQSCGRCTRKYRRLYVRARYISIRRYRTPEFRKNERTCAPEGESQILTVVRVIGVQKLCGQEEIIRKRIYRVPHSYTSCNSPVPALIQKSRIYDTPS